MVDKDTLIRDILYFVKNDLVTNLTDPISRSAKSKFVMTSYPQRPVQYPIVTIRITNIEAVRSGMQTSTQDIIVTLEARIWARNEKEKDEIYDEMFSRLADIQFTTGTGSIDNNLHSFNVVSTNEIDEEGTGKKVTKSRILNFQYAFYNS